MGIAFGCKAGDIGIKEATKKQKGVRDSLVD
jgi:hypothetical protein